ncbi:hypothetical protein CEUSTIGMA_g12424.t1 [Chlamydomonas eustigma]|uniref:FAST kinase leucine-rich domain-containing protein n=1 Tax=Chlamydomonas eustigma TaxID=1157962 RepID=A0A250XPS0_9CHLO|nr:hypothetical protein CEUSTIGMA_g12424.t1 [Chlamydomonas eustigma]|eukprot:GAX85003.1 hypothetical protein CEUSTIGMA_g12424.t1 [Chlamydomonas eustigma]
MICPQLRPRGLVLKRLCSAALSALPSFTPRDMSHLVWALQRMRFLPEPEWMLEAQLAIQAKISQFDEPCLIIMLAAFGGYRYAARNRASKGHTSLILVDSSMVDMLLKRLEQVTVFKTSAVMSRRSCCTLLVALVKLNAPVSNELHRYLLENISLYIEDLPLSQLCLTSWGLSLLGKASGNFMQLRQGSELQILARIQNLTRPHLASSACNSADLLQLLVSFSEASVSPDQEWLHLLEVCAVQHLRTGLLAPTAVSGILGAYKKLGTYHPRTLILTLQGIMTEIKERRLHNLDHELSSRHLIGRRKVSLSSTQRHVVELSQTANSSVLADARF